MRTPIASLRRRLLLLVLLGQAACGAIGFDVGQDLPEQRVPGNPLGGLLPSFIPTPIPLSIDLRAETQRRDTGPATAAYLTSLTLSATPAAAPSGNFDFLDEVRIYVEASDGSLPRREIARLPEVPRGQTTVTFDIVPDVDLLPYINIGASITASAQGTQPRQDFTYNGHIEINVRI